MTRVFARRRTVWIVAVGFLVIGVALTGARQWTTSSHMGSLTLVTQVFASDSATQVIDQQTARATALRKIQDLRPDVTDISVHVGHRASGLKEVRDAAGTVVFSNTDGTNAWVFDLGGPPQEGFKYVSAVAVIDAGTGKVDSISVLLSNS